GGGRGAREPPQRAAGRAPAPEGQRPRSPSLRSPGEPGGRVGRLGPGPGARSSPGARPRQPPLVKGRPSLRALAGLGVRIAGARSPPIGAACLAAVVAATTHPRSGESWCRGGEGQVTGSTGVPNEGRLVAMPHHAWVPSLLLLIVGGLGCGHAPTPVDTERLEASVPASSRPAAEHPAPARPRIVVSVVLDQLGSDTLSRWWSYLEPEGALRRIAANGAYYERSAFPYAGTYTAA